MWLKGTKVGQNGRKNSKKGAWQKKDESKNWIVPVSRKFVTKPLLRALNGNRGSARDKADADEKGQQGRYSNNLPAMRVRKEGETGVL